MTAPAGVPVGAGAAVEAGTPVVGDGATVDVGAAAVTLAATVAGRDVGVAVALPPPQATAAGMSASAASEYLFRFMLIDPSG